MTLQQQIIKALGAKPQINAETYFVALDDTGHVINSGYQTCAEYDTDPQAAK